MGRRPLIMPLVITVCESHNHWAIRFADTIRTGNGLACGYATGLIISPAGNKGYGCPYKLDHAGIGWKYGRYGAC